MTTSAEADVAIRCEDLSIARMGRLDRERIVDGLSFTLERGHTLALMGPTGSGKSSLAAVLAGSDESGRSISGGEAWVEGIRVRRPGRAHRVLTYRTGYLAQSAGATLPARSTVAEVIAEPITSRDRTVNQRALSVRVATLLDELMLPLGAANKYPYELSAGMRQRVAFARAMILQPTVFIADDPFANMDVEVRVAAREAIIRRRDEYAMATLVVTNEMDVARDLHAHVLVMHAGHAIAYGADAESLLWTPSSEADKWLIST
jgi:peptide/nickel transport system ATP-binding protein